MNKFLILTTVAGLLFSNGALAESQEISAALSAVSSAENGTEIAQGLVEIGQSLNAMSIDDTIAFRTGLKLLAVSGTVAEDSSEWKMLQVLWDITASHLVTTCRLEPNEENIRKVNTYFGPPYIHCPSSN